MPTPTRKILQAIIDNPKSTAAELIDAMGGKRELLASDILRRVQTYVDSGQVIVTKHEVAGIEVNQFQASDSLVNVFDGAQQVVTNAARNDPGRTKRRQFSRLDIQFSSGACICLSKGAKKMELNREDSARLIAFLGCINIDKVAEVSA